jgi:hypothetical protein
MSASYKTPAVLLIIYTVKSGKSLGCERGKSISIFLNSKPCFVRKDWRYQRGDEKRERTDNAMVKEKEPRDKFVNIIPISTPDILSVGIRWKV